MRFCVSVSRPARTCASVVDLGQLIICGFQEMEDSFYGLQIFFSLAYLLNSPTKAEIKDKHKGDAVNECSGLCLV